MRVKLVLLSTLLASCSYLSSPVLSPYKMDIRQGNYVTPEMREKLRPGMTKQQVRYVLGTPMVSDAFHGNRWDYIYSLAQRGEVVEKQRLTLHFEGDNLVRMEDGAKPVPFSREAEPQPVPAPPAPPAVVAAPPPPLPPPSPQPEPEPEPEPEPPRPPAKIDLAAEVLKSVRAWSAAWSAKNVRDYLAAYLPDYKPQGMSREAWEKQRLERIGKPGVIEVDLSEISIGVQDDSHATASFAQRYRSDLYRDSTRKTLQFEKIGGVWLISSEQVIR